jgi:hypothetical protein
MHAFAGCLAIDKYTLNAAERNGTCNINKQIMLYSIIIEQSTVLFGMAMTVKMTVFWHMTPCSGGTSASTSQTNTTPASRGEKNVVEHSFKTSANTSLHGVTTQKTVMFKINLLSRHRLFRRWSFEL